MNLLKKYQDFISESNILWNNEQVPPLEKITSLTTLMGIFPSLATFPGGYETMEDLYNTIKNIQKMDNKSAWDTFLPKLIYWENRLGNFVKSGSKGDFGKRDKLSNKTKSNQIPKVQDVYSNAYKKNPEFIDKCIEEFKKIIVKISSSLNSTNTKSDTNSKPTDVQTRYKQLISQWKEQQKKLGKNTNPGEGTRKRIFKQAENEVKK